MIWGYHYFRKHPILEREIYTFCFRSPPGPRTVVLYAKGFRICFSRPHHWWRWTKTMILSTATGRSVASERYRFESWFLGPLDLFPLGDSCINCFYIGRDSGLRSHVQINSFFRNRKSTRWKCSQKKWPWPLCRFSRSQDLLLFNSTLSSMWGNSGSIHVWILWALMT